MAVLHGALAKPPKLTLVVNWFWRKGARVEVPRLRQRGQDSGTTKVHLAELTPDLSTYLGTAAYLQLTIFENLSRAVATAPTMESKEAVSAAAALSLAKHHALTAEIQRHGLVASTVMDPNRAAIDRFQARTQGSDWFEALTSCFVTSGFLDDFFLRLAEGLPSDTAARVTAIMHKPSGEKVIADELLAAITANPRLASRLALWGRRLVGDTMLVARSSLVTSDNHDSDEARIEPVFTELIAAHTRRMDTLGLTA
ncbi:tRNA-(MS[2]IO[6]A)-hydroxylase MiaE-like protein [Glaciihabitans tibetensis]|uniref:tRNA-(MS[2]IO[6]A)-hydroxylase MiaE-like protein n=1 Tax=Glaciihabitans tibetensis TaxID=1266600 RepID=A0A2T0VGW2_9MICO|nr:tRNA-(MS[2]IO[6]A)-hydroxylase MiaE-like protein [Glaciihabitans tibetensis]